LYAMPPQPSMKNLRVGQRFQSKLVGSTISSASGAYAIRVAHPEAITSSEYFGTVNLMIEAAGHGYVTFYGLPRQVEAGGTRLASADGTAAGIPARAHLTLQRLSGRAAKVGEAPATSGCWVLSSKVGSRTTKIDSVFSTIKGVKKSLSYKANST